MNNYTNERVPPTILLALLGSVLTGLIVLFGLIAYMKYQDSTHIQADVCAEVLEVRENHYVHLRVVRGYNEYWDQQIGTNIVVENESPNIKVHDRLTLTARSLWGHWDIDWGTLYEDCPEAFSGTGN